MKIPGDLSNKLTPVADIYMPKGKFDVAVEVLEKLMEDFGEYDIVAYYLGIAYVNLRQLRRGLDMLKELGDSTQLNLVQLMQTNMLVGLAYTDLKQYPDAEKAFKRALELNNDSSMTFSALGYVYYLSKRYDEAIRFFRKAIESDPNNAGARNNLGYTLAEIGINLNEAIRECRKAIALNRKNAAYRDSLGWVFYMTGNFTDSVKELQKALDIDPDNVVIQDHLKKAISSRDKKR